MELGDVGSVLALAGTTAVPLLGEDDDLVAVPGRARRELADPLRPGGGVEVDGSGWRQRGTGWVSCPQVLGVAAMNPAMAAA